MAFDYASFKADVPDTLIPFFGQDVQLSRAARTPEKPWETDQGPAETSAAQLIEGIQGVQIQLTKEDQAFAGLNPEVRIARWVITSTPEIPEELGTEWRLIGDGFDYPILLAQPVNPGGLNLLYFLRVQL